MGKPKRLQMPEPYATITDDASARDRAYFEAHPHIKVYRRAFVPGEFGPNCLDNVLAVEVAYIAPGLRTRAMILLPREVLN